MHYESNIQSKENIYLLNGYTLSFLEPFYLKALKNAWNPHKYNVYNSKNMTGLRHAYLSLNLKWFFVPQ